MKKSTVTMLVLIILLLYAAVNLAGAAKELGEAEKLTEALTQELESAEEENEKLKQSVEALGTDEAEKAFARDFFGFTDGDGIIFIDSN